MHAYNEMAHIPLMIHFPGGEYSGKRIKQLTQNIDLMPTILQHHKCDIPERVKGKSLKDILEGKEKDREQIIYGWFGRAVNVYDGKYTYSGRLKAEITALYINTAEFLLPAGVILTKGMRKR